MNIKVMSYNIRSCIGMDNQVDPKRLADFLLSCDADIVGLQEVSSDHPYLPGVDQLAVLEKETSWKGFFAQTLSRAREGGLFCYGIGILTRLSCEKIAQIALPNVENCEPRTAIILKVEKDGEYFYFVNTHLAYEEHLEDLRVKQLACIKDYVREQNLFPAVITGDFNDTPTSPCLEEMQKEWLFTDLEKLTFPSDIPAIKIDYIGFTPKDAFTFRDYKVIEEKVISDHRPLTVILEKK